MDIITATIGGTNPADRGLEIGSNYGDEIRESVRLYLEFFEIRGIAAARVCEIAESCLSALEQWAPNLAAELTATAKAAGVEAWQLAAVNARTEVLAIVAPDAEGECSTVVHAPRGPAAPLTIQTWDWHAHLCPNGFVLSYIPDVPAGVARRVGRVTTFTECGVLAKIGVNDAGIGVHFNILHHAEDRGVDGVPVHAIARRVLDEATSIDEAEAIIRSAPASASTVLTVISREDVERRAACFEISPARVAVVRPDEQGSLLHTNHFVDVAQVSGEATRDKSTTYARFAHIGEQHAVMALAGTSIEDRAARMCGDAGALAPVCFRPDPQEPLHEQWTTLLTVGLDLVNAKLEFYPGSPAALSEHGAQRYP
ncbi:MAG: C45 family autoproteolytic acyltransferase/hydrolase [Leucobacter sp.]